MIRVLVADDSATLRNTLSTLLAEDADISIVGQARDGVEAVNLARSLRPDVITMDVNMPNLDGLGATAAIMADSPARVLVISSVSEHREQELSFKAMAAGAMELIAKPASGDMRAWGRKVAESIRLMAEVPVVRRARTRSRVLPAVVGDADIVALVASTGGPPALAQVLRELPRDLFAPVLIAQHIAEGFTGGLVRWFSSCCEPRVQVARDGERPEGGHVYLPPDGCDLEVDAPGLLRTPRARGPHFPSGNRLLASLARAYGARAAGFVLTGMGDDGAQGLLALRNAGGATFAQDESTSVVYGMPQAALACGAARSQLALEQVAPAILSLCRKAATK
ncbi:MAG: chemotaxis-specific protein-glutamate methyltransferase CheB [Myxococcales bacterium]